MRSSLGGCSGFLESSGECVSLCHAIFVRSSYEDRYCRNLRAQGSRLSPQEPFVVDHPLIVDPVSFQ